MTNEDIIEVTPLAHSRENSENNRAQSTSAYYTYTGAETTSQPYPGFVPGEGATTASEKSGSKMSGVIKLVAGGACALVGVPMLVLPGPGLLAIGGGVALMASGYKTLTRK